MTRVKFSTILSYGVLIMVSIAAVFPFYLMTIMSTHSNSEITSSLNLLAGKYLIDNAKAVLATGYLRFYWNSFYIASVSALLGVFFSALAGFALSKYNFKGRNLIINFVLATMMVPFGVSIIGFLIEMKNLGWINTHLPLIVPSICSSYGVFLFTQYMKDGIPFEVIESARIDGCAEFKIFLQMAVPFSRAVCITLFLLIFIYSWNNFLTPLILINKEKMYTIPLGIYMLGNQYRQEYGERLFALVLSTIPMLAVFALNSKSLIRGLTAGAVKG